MSKTPTTVRSIVDSNRDAWRLKITLDHDKTATPESLRRFAELEACDWNPLAVEAEVTAAKYGPEQSTFELTCYRIVIRWNEDDEDEA